MDFGGTAEKLTHLQGQGPAEEVERRLARELTSKTRVREGIWNWRANAWTSERLDGRTPGRANVPAVVVEGGEEGGE